MTHHKLVIAEKPSVAQSIAAVLGATKRNDGYLRFEQSEKGSGRICDRGYACKLLTRLFRAY